MMSTTKRRRIGDTPAAGASKLPSGLSVAASSSPDDQQPAVEAQGLISDQYLPAWISIFRSGNGDARSLGRLATRTSKALTQLLESGNGTTDDVWVMLCHRHFDKAMYEAIPEQVRESLGPRRLLAQVGADPSVRVVEPTEAEPPFSLPDPILTQYDTSFLVRVWKGDKVIISQTVTEDELDRLFDKNFVPDIHMEEDKHTHCVSDYDGHTPRESSRDRHGGEMMIKLGEPVKLDKADLSDCKATVHLLFTTEEEEAPKCIPLLQYPGVGVTSKIVCECECSYEENSQQHINGKTLDGYWDRSGFAHTWMNETFLDLDDDGNAILDLVCDRDVKIINGLRFSLNFIFFRPFNDEEEDVWVPLEDLESYLTHFTLRFHAEQNQEFDGRCASCEDRRRSHDEHSHGPPWGWGACDDVLTPEEEGAAKWRESGVTIPHLLPHIKGIKMNKRGGGAYEEIVQNMTNEQVEPVGET